APASRPVRWRLRDSIDIIRQQVGWVIEPRKPQIQDVFPGMTGPQFEATVFSTVESLPRAIASCPVCRRRVLVALFAGSSRDFEVIWDPTRELRTKIGRAWPRWVLDHQDWGLILGGAHECPPAAE